MGMYTHTSVYMRLQCVKKCETANRGRRDARATGALTNARARGRQTAARPRPRAESGERSAGARRARPRTERGPRRDGRRRESAARAAIRARRRRAVPKRVRARARRSRQDDAHGRARGAQRVHIAKASGTDAVHGLSRGRTATRDHDEERGDRAAVHAEGGAREKAKARRRRRGRRRNRRTGADHGDRFAGTRGFLQRSVGGGAAERRVLGRRGRRGGGVRADARGAATGVGGKVEAVLGV